MSALPWNLRPIRQEEAPQAAEIEQICFPPNEACTPDHITRRVRTAPDLFLVAEDPATGKLAGFLCGLATDENAFRDDYFVDASLHRPQKANVLLLGLDVLPQYRGQGLATALMRKYQETQQALGRHSLILTCMPDKIPLYQSMGFEDLGQSASTWGGETWHEMVCILN